MPGYPKIAGHIPISHRQPSWVLTARRKQNFSLRSGGWRSADRRRKFHRRGKHRALRHHARPAKSSSGRTGKVHPGNHPSCAATDASDLCFRSLGPRNFLPLRLDTEFGADRRATRERGLLASTGTIRIRSGAGKRYGLNGHAWMVTNGRANDRAI